MMTDKIAEFRARFEDASEECERFCYPTRGIEFISEAAEKMRGLAEQAELERATAAKEAKEDDGEKASDGKEEA